MSSSRDVRVPLDSLIGQENKGAEYLFMQLAHERVMLVPHSFSLRAIRDAARWASQTRFNGRTVLDQPWGSGAGWWTWPWNPRCSSS